MAKIVHITAHLGAGAGKAISGLAVADKANNRHSICLLAEPQRFNHIDYCRENGIPVHIGGDLERIIAENDIAVINWWEHRSTDALMADFPAVDCQKLVWLHRNGIYDPPLPQICLDFTDNFLVTSEFSKEHPKLKNAPLVYGFGNFEPLDSEYKVDYSQNNDFFTVGFVGEPKYKKLPDDFLDYCEEVAGAIPNTRFVMAGEPEQALIDNVRDRRLQGYFDFRGWTENVRELLTSFDVFGYLLRPNTFATTENAVLEALAAGLPCVVSREPLGGYLLEDGKSGFLADSPKEYARIMKRLHDDGGLRRRVGTQAREYCAAKYVTADNVSRFDDAVAALMDNGHFPVCGECGPAVCITDPTEYLDDCRHELLARLEGV
ncbi:MAG: glycosyltransferase family 4 protein [Oscillospiraceae bacterium]|nr:glycosyltransferase family 4 protein [Oscillospiraceae bacterium]